MAKIEIEWLSDSNDCDTCGGGYAEGAVVKIDGVTALDLTPRSACFDGDHYSQDEVYRRVLAHLGHELVLS